MFDHIGSGCGCDCHKPPEPGETINWVAAMKLSVEIEKAYWQERNRILDEQAQRLWKAFEFVVLAFTIACALGILGLFYENAH